VVIEGEVSAALAIGEQYATNISAIAKSHRSLG
jgi:hypothetical protein